MGLVIKYNQIFSILIFLLLLPSLGKAQLEPWASGREYQNYFIQSQKITGQQLTPKRLGRLDIVFNLGKRNIEWLDYINKFRSEKEKIQFTKQGTLESYPIENPKVYNEKIVLERYEKWLSEVPLQMKKVLIEGYDYTQDPPVDIETYIKFGKSADRIYQNAARWIMMLPNLDLLSYRRVDDVRGFYFLSKQQTLESDFQHWEELDQSKKNQYRDWLILLCYNYQKSVTGCRSQVDDIIKNKLQLDYYKRASISSKKIWDGLFKIPINREDVRWRSAKPSEASIEFLNPLSEKILHFLKINIEDEFRFLDWGLKLIFVNKNNDIPRVEFEEGAVPHVNGVGGNIITMDANSSIDEWDVQWTIRHEFGHVLGFPDCYIEFYIPEEGVMMNYQLDTSNLMCSRTGVFKEIHFQELKRKYFK